MHWSSVQPEMEAIAAKGALAVIPNNPSPPSHNRSISISMPSGRRLAAGPGMRDIVRPAIGDTHGCAASTGQDLVPRGRSCPRGVVPAGATASLTCAADDRNLSFDLLGNIGSGDGGAIQLIEGEIKLKSVRGKFDARQFKVAP